MDRLRRTRGTLSPMLGSYSRAWKAPSVRPVIPPDICALVGQIAVGWGAFEGELNDLLDTLLHATGEVDGRRAYTGPFRTRKILLRQKMQECFADCPVTLATLNEVLHEAADTHWRRNLLLHGRPKTRCDEYGDDVALLQEGTHKGRRVTLEFDGTVVETMVVKIAHMHGRLYSIWSCDNASETEKQRLEVLQDSHPIRGLRAMDSLD